jgi:hypothetical protein
MVKVKVNVIRRSVTVPAKNFVGLPPGGNDGDVVTKVGGKAEWKPPTGGSGSGAVHTRTFSSPLTLWAVYHNLGYKPIVDVFDSAGNKVGADVQHISLSEFYVNFSAANTGSVSYI